MSSPVDRRRFLRDAGLLAAAAMASKAPGKVSFAPGLVNGQKEAADAGHAVLAAGGNAVDAAVAAALVAGVVAVHSTGIGGYGGHLVIAKPDAEPTAIDFNMAAPHAATPDMFPADASGRVKDRRNDVGWLAAGVPGVLAGLQLALDKFGSKTLAELSKPAIRFAREGFQVPRGLAAMFQRHQQQFAKDAASAKLYYRNGRPPNAGELLRNPELADLLQSLAEKGRVDDFYKGRIAEQIAAAFRQNGGLVTVNDMSKYQALEIKPLTLSHGEFSIHTPPPTAGGLTVLQTLATLKKLSWWTGDLEYAMAFEKVEALRLAWADRLRFLGDPRSVDVPIQRLLSEAYAEESAQRVRKAFSERKPIPHASDGGKAGGTIHLNAVDASGMMVALTFTHGNAFGAQVTVEGIGLTLGHGMSRFDPRPGRANSPGSGKRPLHNMCPTIVTKNRTPVLALGATGGRMIPNTVLDVLASWTGGRPLAEAVKAPRVHTEGDLQLRMEASFQLETIERLKRMGYTIRTGPAANLSAIERDPKTGALQSAAR
jgi:gamma-glutamyltranspeptidase / glutathione hydrolase